MNKVELIGRLTSNPDIRGEGTGLTARFTLAVQKAYTYGDESADFIRCVGFGRVAEILERWVTKGKRIGVVGYIHTGHYVNRRGERVYYTNVVAEQVEFLDSMKSDPKPETENDGIEDDMPF